MTSASNVLESDVVAFGKLPEHGDFVRIGMGGSALEALDEAVQQALPALRAQPNGEATEPPVWRFFFAHGRHVLAGAMQLSRDRVGRRYPFLVARASEAADPRDAPRWPVLWRDLFESAERLVGDATSPHDLALHHLPALRDPRDRALRHAHDLDRAATTLDGFLTPMPMEAREALLAHLVAALDGARGPHPPAYGLRFAIRDAEEHAAFWLEAEWRLRGARVTNPAAFWTASGDAPQLVSFARGIPRGGLAPVLGAEPPPRAVCHLADIPPGLPALSMRHRRLLAHAPLTLTQFLHAL